MEAGRAEAVVFPVGVPVTVGDQAVPTPRPAWIKDYLSSAEIERIEKLIAEIELKTEGEIVPILVQQSVLSEIPWWAKNQWGQKLLFSKQYLNVSADLRAELEFYRSRVFNTKKKTGILLFMSFYEHRAVVLADKGIAELLPAHTWDEVVKLLTSAVKTNQLADGLSQAIRKCGDILIRHFPQNDPDENQLCNQLRILD